MQLAGGSDRPSQADNLPDLGSRDAARDADLATAIDAVDPAFDFGRPSRVHLRIGPAVTRVVCRLRVTQSSEFGKLFFTSEMDVRRSRSSRRMSI